MKFGVKAVYNDHSRAAELKLIGVNDAGFYVCRSATVIELGFKENPST